MTIVWHNAVPYLARAGLHYLEVPSGLFSTSYGKTGSLELPIGSLDGVKIGKEAIGIVEDERFAKDLVHV